MCGLVGYYGQYDVASEKAVKDLLRVDVVRGPHSTGVAFVNVHTGNQVIVKHALLPDDMFETADFVAAMTGIHQVMIGHNRYATKGAVNKVNAHPFDFDNVVGAHNGTLVNQRLLPDHEFFEVDSENIYHSIDTEGIDKTWPNLHGAAALSWWDKEHKTMNLARNSQRPLFYTYTENNKGVFWASEEWMLKACLARNNIKHGKLYDVRVDEVHIFQIGSVTKKIKNGSTTFQKVQMGRRKLEKYIPKTYGVSGQNHGYRSGYGVFNHDDKPKTFGKSQAVLNMNAPTSMVIGAEYIYQPKHVVNMPKTGTDFIMCNLSDDKRVNVHIPLITPEDQRLVEAMKNKNALFKGRVYSEEKGLNGQRTLFYRVVAPFVTVFNEDTGEVLDDAERRETIEGIQMTREEFDVNYINCACCSDPLLFEDTEIDFISERVGLCGTCAPQLRTFQPEIYEQLRNGAL